MTSDEMQNLTLAPITKSHAKVSARFVKIGDIFEEVIEPPKEETKKSQNGPPIVPFKQGRKMTNAERLNLLNIIFDWDIAEETANNKKPLAFIKSYLREKFGYDVSRCLLYNLKTKWACTYNDKHEIIEIYRIKK